MTRAHIADPDLVQKLIRGEEDHIRPCVGAAYCLYKKVNCIHNPSSGREVSLPHDLTPADHPRRAVVIGAGPAGLEAARVLAERGHNVTLLEAAGEAGGQVLLAAAAPQRGNLIGLIDWRLAELARLGVEIRYNCFAEGADVLALAPQIVIVATGGLPDLDWLDGGDLCQSSWDILGNMVPGRGEVLVYDGTGRQAAPTTALKLAEAGHKLSLVTPDDALAIEMSYTDRSGIRKRFHQEEIPVLTDHRLIQVARKDARLVATLRNEMTHRETTREADQVIVEHGSLPMDMLYHELREASGNDGVTDQAFVLGRTAPPAPLRAGFELHRIGDAVASRDIYATILESFRLCRLL